MGSYLLGRIAQGILTLVVASVLIFVVIRLVPGDPALLYAGNDATPETIRAIREQFGLDQPLLVQYALWVKGCLAGRFGRSFVARVPVTMLIGQRILPTLLLLGGAVIVMAVAGFLIGVGAAVTRRRFVDTALTGLAGFLSGAPVFWIGLLAILVFALQLRWLPVGGYVNPFEDPVGGLRSLVMPSLVLGLALAGTQARFIRAAYKEVLNADFIRLAEAKGASRARVVWRHATRNALVPVVTVFGLSVANLLGGAVVIETVFTWPGLGLLMINSVNANDYPTIQVILLLYVLIFVVMNLLTDLSYSLIDPRISLVGRAA